MSRRRVIAETLAESPCSRDCIRHSGREHPRPRASGLRGSDIPIDVPQAYVEQSINKRSPGAELHSRSCAKPQPEIGLAPVFKLVFRCVAVAVCGSTTDQHIERASHLPTYGAARHQSWCDTSGLREFHHGEHREFHIRHAHASILRDGHGDVGRGRIRILVHRTNGIVDPDRLT